MNALLINAAGNSPGVAGLWFIVGFLIGLAVVKIFGKVTIWPAIIVMVAACLIRGFSEPLGALAVSAISVVHISIGCLAVLIARNTKPAVR